MCDRGAMKRGIQGTGQKVKRIKFDVKSGQEAMNASKEAVKNELQMSFADPDVFVNKGKISPNGFTLSFNVEVKLVNPGFLEVFHGNKEQAEFAASALDWNSRHYDKINSAWYGTVLDCNGIKVKVTHVILSAKTKCIGATCASSGKKYKLDLGFIRSHCEHKNANTVTPSTATV